MKPGVDEKVTSNFPSIMEPEHETARSMRKTLIVGAAVGLTILLVIAGVSIGTFYLGLNAGKDSYKEAWLTYKTGSNNTIIKERVVVREKETSITRPGELKVVIDYDAHVVVIQYIQKLDGDEDLFCYVYDFVPGSFGSSKDDAKAVSGEQSSQTVTLNGKKITLESTGVEIPIEQLSPTAKDMCFGATILKVRETTEMAEQQRRKRGCWRVCATYCRNGRCYRVCYTRCS